MRLVLMGSPEFSLPVFRWLRHSSPEVVAVYTQADKPAGRGQLLIPCPVKRWAVAEGLPVFTPRTFKDSAEVSRLASLRPDVIIVAAYGKLLPQALLDIPPHGCLNVHPSLLPRHRGASPVAWAILSGDATTGVSIMLLEAGMDSGPLLAQVSLPIEETDTTGTLTAKLADLGAPLLGETLPRWLERSLVPRPQDHSQATYSRPLSKEEGELDWRLPALVLWRRVRAFEPWPGAYTWWHGQRLKIIEARPHPEGVGPAVGQVLALKNPLGVGVVTGEGVLQLLRMQREGRRPLSAEEFLRGQRDFLGATLPSWRL